MYIKRHYLRCQEHPTIFMLLPSILLYCLLVRGFVKKGYKYIVGWKDVGGIGLQVSWRADWQGDKSSVYHNPWWRS